MSERIGEILYLGKNGQARARFTSIGITPGAPFVGDDTGVSLLIRPPKVAIMPIPVENPRVVWAIFSSVKLRNQVGNHFCDART